MAEQVITVRLDTMQVDQIKQFVRETVRSAGEGQDVMLRAQVKELIEHLRGRDLDINPAGMADLLESYLS